MRRSSSTWKPAAEGGAPYPITREQKLHNIAVLEAVVTSVETKEAVTVS